MGERAGEASWGGGVCHHLTGDGGSREPGGGELSPGTGQGTGLWAAGEALETLQQAGRRGRAGSTMGLGAMAGSSFKPEGAPPWGHPVCPPPAVWRLHGGWEGGVGAEGAPGGPWRAQWLSWGPEALWGALWLSGGPHGSLGHPAALWGPCISSHTGQGRGQGAGCVQHGSEDASLQSRQGSWLPGPKHHDLSFRRFLTSCLGTVTPRGMAGIWGVTPLLGMCACMRVPAGPVHG